MLIAFTLVLAAIFASVLKDFDVTLLGTSIKWPINDKISHFFGAGLFAFLLQTFTNWHLKIKGREINLQVLGFLLFSILEETSQIYRVNRGFSFADMAANILGIIFFSKLAQKALKDGCIIR